MPQPWGPVPDPWIRLWPLASGIAGAVGGVLGWELVGDRFADAGSLGAVAVIAILSGSVAVSALNAIGSLRAPSGAAVERIEG